MQALFSIKTNTCHLAKINSTKETRRIVARDYGLKINSPKNNSPELFISEKKEIARTNIDIIIKLIEELYLSKNKNLTQAKKDISEILGIKFLAKDKLSFSEKIINLINFKCVGEKPNRLSNENKIRYYELVKFHTFAASSRLEGVHVIYTKSSLNKLEDKAKKNKEKINVKI